MAYPRNIMLIDDDHDDHEIFVTALSAIDTSIRCIYYDDARIALDKILNAGHELPDFIFLDLNMPAINGKECLRLIKESAHLAHVPTVLYSTSIMPSDETAIMALGAHSFFTKPHSLDGLVKSLIQIFESSPVSEH